MKLPQGEHAIVPIAKLREYCLNGEHPLGKHKARVFAAALGMSQKDAEFLRSELLRAAITENAVRSKHSRHGEQYTIDTEIRFKEKSAVVRAIWVIDHGQTRPRLITCYVI